MNAIEKTKEQLNHLVVLCDKQIVEYEKKLDWYKALRVTYQHALSILEKNETEESRSKFEELIKE